MTPHTLLITCVQEVKVYVKRREGLVSLLNYLEEHFSGEDPDVVSIIKLAFWHGICALALHVYVGVTGVCRHERCNRCVLA